MKIDNFQLQYLNKSNVRISTAGKQVLLELNTDKSLNGIVVIRALPPFHGGSLEISLRVPLIP